MGGFRAFLIELWAAVQDWFAAHWRGLARWGGFALAVLATPVALLYLLPSVLGLFAPKIDFSKDLYAVNRPVAFTFLDAKGRVAGHRGAVVGDRLTLNEMPPYLPAAFIAMEDRRFYDHHGIDPRGLIRAIVTDLRAGHWEQGGSTITQQTAKILFTQQERTFNRKFAELWDAVALEKSLSKDQILALYLNRIYLGSGAYGVDGAARVYFGKSARDVTLAEAAMLATLTRAPTVFSPRRDLAAAQQRAGVVLHAMVETGAITQAQADDAIAHPADVVDHTTVDARNYFLDTAADEVKKLVDTSGDMPDHDLIVHTTLEPKIEEAARHALAATIAKRGKKLHASEGAVVVMKLDGAVSALIGGTDYDESVFNRATLAHRQPGSAFKPFVYLAAVENGISPWDTRTDGPVDIDGWTPTNYGGRSYGMVTVADALAHSINTITAELAQEVGITTVVDAAKRLGIASPLEANASLALGTSEVTPLELTSAYAAFASGGIKTYPYFVTQVTDTAGRVLYRRKAPPQERVIASHVDRDMTEMMYGVVTDGTGRGAALPGRECAGKTGTTQDYHDAWFVGFTTDYVAGVWIGNDDSSPMKGVTGGSLPAAVWKQVMEAAEAGKPAEPLDKSEPEETTDETVMMSGGVDDEQGGGDDDESGAAPQNGGPRQSRQGFWDWLFGHPQAAPPPGEYENGGAPDSSVETPDDEDQNPNGQNPPPQPHIWRQRENPPPPPPGNDGGGGY